MPKAHFKGPATGTAFACRFFTQPDSNRKIIEEVVKYAYEHEAVTGHFPKILIFAVNDLPHNSHGDQLVKTCRAVFNQATTS